ncbi:MAG: flagellar hook-basal body complex protein FliE [Hyphomicrobiales bacterium]|nr:flagellar hook-basal body complex protein FliE [Hyphomicrobiales bacterium]
MIDPVSAAAIAAGFMDSASRIGQASPAGTASSSAADFSEALASAANDVIGSIKKGEAAAIAHVQGSASTQQIVEAVMAAEQALQTAVSVRDRAVAAYQEISRMAI